MPEYQSPLKYVKINTNSMVLHTCTKLIYVIDWIMLLTHLVTYILLEKYTLGDLILWF